MNINKRMTSIARKINMSFWFKRLWGMLGLDFLILALVACSFIYWRYQQLPAECDIQRLHIENVENYKETEFIIEDSEGTQYPYLVHQFTDYLVVPFLILLGVQVMDLVMALFETGDIRKKLKPLNELAIKAEKLSSLPLDTSKFESLEHAIESLSPDAPDARISTGDRTFRASKWP